MSDKGTKRARNDQPEAVATTRAQLPGRDQLFLTSPELQARHGKKYCDDAELLPVLLPLLLALRIATTRFCFRSGESRGMHNCVPFIPLFTRSSSFFMFSLRAFLGDLESVARLSRIATRKY
jgi:hypothetical protein